MRSFTLRDRRAFLRHLLTIFVGALVGCDDVTAPDPVAPLPGLVRHAAAAGAPVVVWPGDLHAWSFVQESTGKPCAEPASCRFVAGPATPPLGGGSAELAASRGSGVALVLREYLGTRLDRFTTLRYATYRQGAVAENDALVTLRLTVQFDASGGGAADVGQLVHDPSAVGGGAVVGDRWQSWDALAGLWWLDRESPQAVRGAGAHPCVRARPCTWAMLLARFPDMAIHPSAGAVAFVTGRGEFRGSVDSLAVGIDGATSVFDFELEPRRVSYLLGRTFGDGVVVDQLPADTLFREGTLVPYAFSSRPGRAAPLVILDDTLAPVSGRIAMNAAHVLQVVSDTIYSAATLTPLEQRAAALTRELLSTGDKMAAARAFNDFLVAELLNGTDDAVLARAVEVADYVTVDPVRDSAAVRMVDEGLRGHDFQYSFRGGNEIFPWTSIDQPAYVAPVASLLPAPHAGLAPGGGASPEPPASGLGQLLAPGVARHTVAAIDNPENPRELTKVIYTNGVLTYRGTAFVSATLLAKLLYAIPRFGNYYTSVVMHYNPTQSAQMAQYDAEHPCLASAVNMLPYQLGETALVAYAACRGVRLVRSATSQDFVEAAMARAQFIAKSPPTTEAVMSLARLVAALRAPRRDTHVLLVGHSEGTILQAQAVQALPTLERHPPNIANRCIGVLALAPAVERTLYGLDDFHVKGLLARNDAISFTLPGIWEEVDTPFASVARDTMAKYPLDLLLRVRLGTIIHGVNFTYLTGNVAPVVAARLTTLHRECIPGSADLQLASPMVPLGTSVTASLDIVNQNQRPLVGRQLTLGRYGYFFDRTDSLTFRAMAPYDGQLSIGAVVTPGLDVAAPVRIPLVRPEFSIRETLLWEWVAVAAGNGPDTVSAPVPVPTDPWDGSTSSCYRQQKLYSPAGNWVTYELRCNRAYTPVFVKPDTLITGRRVVGARVFFTDPKGMTSPAPQTYYYCAGALPCVASGYLELLGALGVVGRSSVVTPAVGVAPSVAARLPATGSAAYSGVIRRALARGAPPTGTRTRTVTTTGRLPADTMTP